MKPLRILSMIAAIGIGGPSVADDSQEPAQTPVEQIPVTRVLLSAADEPSPALRYPLTMPFIDQTDGNAATFYYRALLLLRTRAEADQKILLEPPSEWLELPLEKFPAAEARKVIDSLRNIFQEVEAATRCEHCRWDLRLRELRGFQVVGLLLPEWQEWRQLAKLIALRTRLAIVEKKFEVATDSLRMGYRLARDASQEPILICGLVGIACGQIMNATLLELIQAEGTPNLYWSLASLPSPLVDLRPAAAYEMTFVYQIFPVLRGVETARRTPEQWNEEIKQLLTTWNPMSEMLGEKVTKTPAPAKPGATPFDKFAQALEALELTDPKSGLTVRLRMAVPQARTRLIDRGRKAEDVAAMPESQVLLIDAAQNYAMIRDEYFKGMFLPYDQSYVQTRLAEKSLTERGWLGPKSKEPLAIAGMLMPAVSQARFAEIRISRSLAELRLLEAIRMHAARNEGRLPKSLEEITAVPVPVDPLTAKPYPYRVEGDEAVIESVPPEGRTASNGRIYRVKMRTR